jgi:hypothetical protein
MGRNTNYENRGRVKRRERDNELLQHARRENIIVRSPDGTEFILAEIDDLSREIELTRQNKKFMRLLDRRAKQAKTMSMEEAKAKLGLSEPV